MKNKNGRWRRNKPARDETAAGNRDRLSRLPDDILINIPERVDTLDAIRTCILSKQLLRFPAMLSHLFISVSSIACHLNLAREISIRDIHRISRAVADVTDNILSTTVPECPKLLTPVLSKLQKVNLENLHEGCDFAWTMFILEAAPSLKELCITIWDHWCIMATGRAFREERGYCKKAVVGWKTHAPDFKHKNLVKLTIYGFQPGDNSVRYIRRVMEVAVNIAEISLHDRKVCGRCGFLDPKIKVRPSRYPRTVEERKLTIEELGLDSPSVVHFRS